MELVKKVPSVPPLRAIPGHPQTLGYFGVIAAASNTISSFYQDTSFQKPHLEKALKSKRQASLQPKLQKVQKSLQQIQVKVQKRLQYQYKIQTLLLAMQTRFREIQNMNQAAQVIQRAYRSHLTARAADELYIKLRKEELLGWTKHLDSMHSVWIYQTGFTPDIMSRKIQRSIKRHLFRGKIARITKTYEIISNLKIFQAFQIVRRQIYVFKARSKVKYQKFKIYRRQRLVQIKRRLAVLVVANYWRAEKINMRLIRQRIRRYKRKLRKEAELQMKRLAENDEQERESQAEEKKQTQQKPENQQEDSQQEQLRERLQAIKREKIRMGKIAYSIPKQKNKSFLPYLKKELQKENPLFQTYDNIPVPKKYQKFTQKLFDRLGRPLFKISQQPRSIPRRQILPPKYKRKGNPRYMEPTQSSRPPPTPTSQNTQPEISSRKLKNSFMKMTKSHQMKKNQKHQRSVSVDNKPKWQFSFVSRQSSKIEFQNSLQSLHRKKVGFSRVNSRLNQGSSIKIEQPSTQIATVMPQVPELKYTLTPAFTSTIEEALPELTQFLLLYSHPKNL